MTKIQSSYISLNMTIVFSQDLCYMLHIYSYLSASMNMTFIIRKYGIHLLKKCAFFHSFSSHYLSFENQSIWTWTPNTKVIRDYSIYNIFVIVVKRKNFRQYCGLWWKTVHFLFTLSQMHSICHPLLFTFHLILYFRTFEPWKRYKS